MKCAGTCTLAACGLRAAADFAATTVTFLWLLALDELLNLGRIVAHHADHERRRAHPETAHRQKFVM